MSVLAVRPCEDVGHTFALKTFARAELTEAELVDALEPWLSAATEVVTIGGGDTGPALLAMTVARSGRRCPQVASLAMPPVLQQGRHIRLLNEFVAVGAMPAVSLDDLAAGLGVPFAGAIGRSPLTTEEDCWGVLRRHSEVQAITMWLVLTSLRAARAGDTDAMPTATRSIDDWIWHSMENLRHLEGFASEGSPFTTSERLCAASEPVL